MKFIIHNSHFTINALWKSLNYALCIMNCALATSCNTDELCYNHPHDGKFYIHFDWSDAPEATPSGMRVWFYPLTGADSYTVDLSATDDNVEIRELDYHILAHNNGTEWLTFTGTDAYHTHTITTRDGGLLEPMGAAYRASTLSNDNDDSRIAVAPEPVYSVGVENITVHHGDGLTLKPQARHCHYTYEFRNVGSLKHVAHISAAISGMADGINLVSGEHSTTTCTIPVEAGAGSDGTSIVGSFYTFGHHPDITAPHRMSLYVVMDDGKQYKYVTGDYLDVTSQIHDAPDPRNVHIIINGLELPTAIENGSGFTVDLNDWEDVNYDIEM